ncbi:unnamed protein product, partial [Effrenium voratum]
EALGALWSERLETPSVARLSGQRPLEELEAPSASSEPKARATALVRAALGQLAQEPPQQQDAVKDSKEALSIFRGLELPECEATALLALSACSLELNPQESAQAATQAIKIFAQLGHYKGQTAALQAMAKADQARQCFDDASYKASEALKMARQLGDRAREIELCEIIAEVSIAQDRAEKAVAAAKDAAAIAKTLENEVLLARAQCWTARAYGAYQEPMMSGPHAAKAALQLYAKLENKSGEVQALQALAAATKEDFSDVLSTSLSLAEKFASGDKKEEADCLLVAVSCWESSDLEQAQRMAQRALSAAKAGGRGSQAQALLCWARLALKRQEPTEALRIASQAGGIFRNEPFQTKIMRDGEIECVEIQMDSHVMLGNAEEAFRLGLDQGRRFKQNDQRKAEGCVLLKLASLHQMRLEEEKALKVLLFAPRLFSISGDRLLEGSAWERIARSYLEAGDAGNALQATEQCVGSFRKVNSRSCRGRAALLKADVHTALVSVQQGNSVEALEAAQEAAEMLTEKDLALKALAVQLLANAYLLNGQPEAALDRARESQALEQQQKQAAGEAMSLLLEAGAHLALEDFESSRQCARSAKELFSTDLDEAGESSAKDFLSFVQKAEQNEEDLRRFRGFGLRRVSAAQARQKAAARREAQSERKPRQLLATKQSDILLWQCDPKTKDSSGLVIMTIFEGFEVREGVARQQTVPLKKKEQSEADEEAEHTVDFSKDYKDSVKQGYPETEPAVFAVRWVQATDTKEPPRSRRELRREEDKRVVSVQSLGAPAPNCAHYAKSERLEAPGERHGYRIY